MNITWFGHSAFRIAFGKTVLLIDPFLNGNPTFEAAKIGFDQAIAGVTHVALTHGHEDHIGDTVAICANRATLIANWEICNYLGAKGVASTSAGNHGGEIIFDEFSIAFVNAWHSSSVMIDGRPVYLGNPAGLIVKADGKTVLHMGDTGMHSDMALIQELYAPQIGIVPIGDRFTMGAKQAAFACHRFFKFETIIPCHYGTFPVLDASAEKFIAEAKGLNVVVPKPGQTIEF